MSEKVRELAGNFTRAKFSNFAESGAVIRFDEWLRRFSANRDSIPPPVGEIIPSSDHEGGTGAIWYTSGEFVYGSANTGYAYRVPLTMLDSMPSVNLT